MDKWTGKRVMLGAAMLAASLALCIGGRSAVQAVMHHDSARTLVIDAGHGGFDGGAVGSNGTTEQDINLSIAQRVQSLAAFFGVRTAMTRTDENALDYDPSRPVRENKIADIKAREQFVQDTADPVFLSIHLNKFSDAQYHGAQVFYADEASSLGLAQHTQELLRLALDPENRRQAARLPNTVYLMTHITCRAILVECGFLSNPEEDALQTGSYQTKIAAALACAYLSDSENDSEGEGTLESQDSLLLYGMRE